jgi:hypothetical protein
MTKEMVDSLPEREHFEAVEILPSNIGKLPAKEVGPLLERASSRIDIVKPKSEFWEGMRQNLEGAASYIKAEKSRIASKTFRAIAGASLVGSMVSACAKSPETPDFLPTQEAVATEVMTEPTASPEMINSLNESAQSLIDESFAGLGIHEVSLIGAGTLTDSSGTEYALFTSILPDEKNNQELDFLLLGELGEDSQVESIKGLVTSEENVQTPVLEFIAVSFNPETKSFSIEGPYIRTNTQTGQVEIFRNGNWEDLRGPDQTIDDVQEIFGGGVLAARTLPTPTAEPTQEASPTPEVQEREVAVVPELPFNIPSEMLEPLEESEITRIFLQESGEELPYGIIEEWNDTEGTSHHIYISGIIRGFQPHIGHEDGVRYLIVEVPLESGNSQYLRLFVPNVDYTNFDRIYMLSSDRMIPQSDDRFRGFQYLQREGMPYSDFFNVITDERLVGWQTIFVVNTYIEPEGSSAELFERGNQAMDQFVENMLGGELSSDIKTDDVWGRFNMAAIVLPEDVVQ